MWLGADTAVGWGGWSGVLSSGWCFSKLAPMTDEQFERHALTVLARELGPGGFAGYLMLFRSGKGDYTAERQKWQEGLTVEDIWKQMEAEGLTAK